MTSTTLYTGDCLEVLSGLEPNSIDTTITDPPYGLGKQPDARELLKAWLADEEYEAGGGGFMNAQWDAFVPGPRYWKAVKRVMKPGAFLLAMGGTRTYDLLTLALRLAGFEIRDCLVYCFGSGFPKSASISKQLDKAARRYYVQSAVQLGMDLPDNCKWDWTKGEHSPGDKWWERFKKYLSPQQWEAIERDVIEKRYSTSAIWGNCSGEFHITAPATPAAQLWDGWGTALKPAVEMIVVAMKPREKTFAFNAQKWGVAGLWIDGARIATGDSDDYGRSASNANGTINAHNGFDRKSFKISERDGEYASDKGRWPANLILDGSPEVLACFPETAGDSQNRNPRKQGNGTSIFSISSEEYQTGGFSDSGSAARYFQHCPPDDATRLFYCAKASRRERDLGLEGMKGQYLATIGNSIRAREHNLQEPNAWVRNHHKTVKPLSLMRYLVRLTRTPTSGVVLDPFCGSGTTGCACVLEDRDFIGVDIDAEYIEIARRRIEYWRAQASREAAQPKQLELTEVNNDGARI